MREGAGDVLVREPGGQAQDDRPVVVELGDGDLVGAGQPGDDLDGQVDAPDAAVAEVEVDPDPAVGFERDTRDPVAEV